MKSIVEEIHSSHLTATCMRRVQLTAQGKRIGATETAKYRGLLAHKVLAKWFSGQFAIGNFPPDLARSCHMEVKTEAERDNEPLSQAVIDNAGQIHVEVGRLCDTLTSRWVQFHQGWKCIGAELPIRWDMELPGFDAPVPIASHLDLLFKTPSGYAVVDIKTGEDDPSPHYLNRNPQLASYFLALRHGAIQTDAEFDLWETIGEYPTVYWMHFNAVAPYSRKTKAADENGELREYAAGEHKPWHRIMRACDFQPEMEGQILADIATRVKMFEAGLFPPTPDPIGCRVCDCNYHCPSYGRGT